MQSILSVVLKEPHQLICNLLATEVRKRHYTQPWQPSNPEPGGSLPSPGASLAASLPSGVVKCRESSVHDVKS
jgi:hypothetical protein